MRKIIHFILLASCLTILSACGGGDNPYPNNNNNNNNNNNDNNNGSNLAISLTLLDQATKNTTDSVSATSPAVLQATVTDGGTPMASEVVTFTANLGTLDPAAGTALTNASGVASINLLDGGVAGAGKGTAKVEIAGVTVEKSINFQVVTNPVTTTTIDMGNGTGGAFVADIIDLNITSLSAGGTLTATVNIVETSNANSSYTTPVDVAFESDCTKVGTASMDPSVTTVNGTASSTYQAEGCVGTDIITARASVGGTTYTAQANVTIQPPTVGSIKFTSATPKVIALKGTGGPGLSETSTIVFTVYDENDQVVPNQTVDFFLSTKAGGIDINQDSATSNASGRVQTVVNSGTVNTSVSVTARVTLDTTTIETQSVALAVSTGIPDDNSFTIAAENINPSVWECNGGKIGVTAFVADHFNNPAPDGTSVAFQTEGGFINGSCTTIDGQCTVDWTSDNPRPDDARVTILATLIGEEGFTDTNANGRFDGESYTDSNSNGSYDAGEPFTDSNDNGSYDANEPFKDLPEAWRDDNENGIRDADEEFLDFNSNTMYDEADGTYNGTLCVPGISHCNELVHARSSLTLVMASVNQGITLYEETSPGVYEVISSLSPILLPNNKSVRNFRVDVQDARGQRPPAGTTISVATDNGTVVGGSSLDVLNSSSPGPVSLGFSLKGDDTPDQGVLTITVAIPDGACQAGVVRTFNKTVDDSLDVTPPTVIGSTPTSGDTGVAADLAVLEIEFSETMDETTLMIVVTSTTADPGVNVPSFIENYDTTTNKLFLFPTTSFDTNEFYTLTVKAAAKDTNGYFLNGGDGIDTMYDHEFIFKTAP